MSADDQFGYIILKFWDSFSFDAFEGKRCVNVSDTELGGDLLMETVNLLQKEGYEVRIKSPVDSGLFISHQEIMAIIQPTIYTIYLHNNR